MTDHDAIRRFVRAADAVMRAGSLDAYHAEVRRTQPAHGVYDGTIGQRLYAAELARLVPAALGGAGEAERIALEHVMGSDAMTRLRAMETVASEIVALVETEAAAPAEVELDPPPPPAEWRSAHDSAPAPIVIESAGDVPVSIRLARARKAAGK